MRHYASFDIGGSGVKYGVVNEHGHVIEKGMSPTPPNLDSLLELMAGVMKDYQHRHSLVGIGIGIPGAVNNDTGIIGGITALDYIHHFDIRSVFESRLGLPVAMANDANCSVLAEGWVGAAKNASSYASVVIGTGIGGGYVQNGQLVVGKNQLGAEFGYMIIDPLGRTNWSDLGATRILLEKAALVLNVDKIDGVELFRLAEEGHSLINTLLEEFYFVNALGIYNICHAIDPELILIGGGISQQPKVVTGINNQLKILLSKGRHVEIEVKACEFLNDANLIGAVYNYRLINEAGTSVAA